MIELYVIAALVGLTGSFPHGSVSFEDTQQGEKCGYNSCPVPKPGMLNVHIVPHTHDDVGWLKTLDQYYYGSKSYIQKAGVQYIIDSVVNELFLDPKKKFIYVETAFFWKWWKEQEDYMRHRVKRLVYNGQLEFIGGAWSMHDEATTHYQSIIDQFTWGLRKLNDTFGPCGQPRVGWQIDPFGHSRESAAMMAQFGFDGLFFGRLDYQDKSNRMKKQTMEMIWEGNPSLGSSGNLFTGALYNLYTPPKGFCFDILCDDDPVIDDPHSPEYNVQELVKNFTDFARTQAESYRVNNIVMTFGMDFNYQFAHINFKNMDKLIRGYFSHDIYCLGKSADLMTGALYNHYAAPPGFCFDILCDDIQPLIVNPKSPEYNIEEKVTDFIKFVMRQRKRFLTDNVILTMGDDFNYQDAQMYFKNLDILIRAKIRNTRACLPSYLFLAKGAKAETFTGVLYNLYQSPLGFCFDIMCGDEPILDDIYSPDYNVDRRVSTFLKYIERQSESYRVNEMMLTMGGDFNYQDAHYYYKNLDKLIRYVNERQKNGSKVNAFYSTPSCYLKSLNDANITWPTKQDDFFPYASDPHAYWTGYFTSRPTLKYFERQGNNLLQICKQISSLALLGPEVNPDMDVLREAMGVMQHHDAITGTEKQAVAFDYARILHEGIKKCEIVTNAGLNKLMTQSDQALPPLTFTSCLLSNISECSVSSLSQKFLVTVYNPMSRPVNFYVRLPVSSTSYSVKSPDGLELLHQIVKIPLSVSNIPGRNSAATKELVFKAKAVPPLGYRSYYVRANPQTVDEPQEETFEDSEEVALGDDNSYFTINPHTGLLSGVSFQGRKIVLNQTLEFYYAQKGMNDKFEDRASGAYIFRPQGNESFQFPYQLNNTVYKGPVVVEVHQVFSSWASQVVRQYVGESHMEVEWLVGPIPIDDNLGKEVIAKYKSNIDSQGYFTTDSNGRQTLLRKRNFRPTWNVDLQEPVSGNYYPVTTDISIKDRDLELTILIDRAEGGGSIQDGEIELMLHRRLLYDDGFGVDEALNEEAFGEGLVARGRHWVLLGNVTDPNWPKQKRLLLQEKILSPQILLTDVSSGTFESLKASYRFEYSGLTQSLPPSVQILTLEPWKGQSYLLRLEHLLDKAESDEVVTVNLTNLFSAFEITKIRETSLAADRWLSEVSRLKWRKETNEVVDEEEEAPKGDFEKMPIEVQLKPKEIRTFICEIKPKQFI